VIADTVRAFLREHGVEGPLLVAVSGGTDSTALFVALVEIGTPIIAAHVNHHLRGAESDGDESFVRDLCARHGIDLHVADGTIGAEALRRHGLEAAAREVRHARLHEIRLRTGTTHIATAHQKNDQAETVLMRLMTGSGLAGLRGIHPLREDGVVRPMLQASRAEVEAFLAERGISARHDRMNRDPRFLRTRVRAALAQFDEAAIDGLASVARHADEQWTLLQRLLDGVDHGVRSETETRFPSFPDDPALRRALLHRHIRRLDPASRDVSAADLQRLAALDTVKRVSVTRSLELLRRGGEWILRRRPQPAEPFQLDLRAGNTAFIPQIGATIRVGPATRQPGHPATQVIQLPPGSEPAFTVRNRRDGDRFQPLGMERQKKLKDFLIDRKIAVETRDRIPLLIWRGTIACVGGLEISEAFKITGSGELYEIAIEKADSEGVQ